ncbi:ROK family protein [Cetobacterium sp. SF1]|uniref:ROK family protein n=1 Tax=unclassified Cetobacterium TaxID=2630983 RepID=UPI003CF4A9CF
MNETQLEVLKLIKNNKSISRLLLAETLEITPAAISKIIKNLINDKIVLELSQGPSTGGRKPTMLSINYEKFGKILGITFAPSEIYFVIGNFSGEILFKKTIIFENDDNLISNVISFSKKLINKYSNISMISIIMNGFINFEEGISIFSPHYKWKNINLKSIFQKEFNIPILIENDVRAMAMSEKVFGSCQTSNNFVLINVGNGIGSSIFTNGEIYRGQGSIAGEIGHIIVDRTSIRKCSCGKRGCLEAEASNLAIINKLTSQIKLNNYSLLKDQLNKNKYLTIKDVLEGVKERDFLSTKATTEAIIIIAHAIDMIISLINPEKIILVGDLFQDKFLINTLHLELQKVILKEQQCQIVISNLLEDIYIYAPLALSIYSIFNNKNFTKEIFIKNNLEVI